MSYRRVGKILSAAVLGCVLTTPAWSQNVDQPAAGAAARARAKAEAAALPQPDANAGGDPAALAGKESADGVYVRDSAIALEKLALAQRMERLKEWDKSADVYQEVIDQYADRVVPSRTNDDDKVVQYASVTRGVMERLAKWPREGVDVYRARFEPAAAAMLDAPGGRDPVALSQLVSRYFITTTAKNAGLRLVELYLERGEFQAAARLADELLDLHPDLEVERPLLLFRSALAHRLAGDTEKAAQRLATLQKNFAAAVGTVRGKEVVLATSLAEELDQLKGVTDATASADSWTTFGGDATRGRVPAAAGRPGAHLYSVAMAVAQRRGIPPAVRARLEEKNTQDRALGLSNGVFPVTDRGELFFQDGTRVYATSLESGQTLPGWAKTYPGPENLSGQYVLPNAVGFPRTHQLTLTLTDRAVIGVMGQADRSLFTPGANLMAIGAEPRLVCLDRATGKENWLIALSNVPMPKGIPDDQQKAIRALRMSGAPVAVGDSVFVSARGVKQGTVEEAWVICFDLPTGRLRWACYIASSGTAGAPWAVKQPSLESTAQLAYADGRIYAMSNLGALAAIDAYVGNLIWLDVYGRSKAGFDPNQAANPFLNVGGGGQPQQAVSKPFTYNPVIVKDGRIFALPDEGSTLFIYDATTGAEVKQIHGSDYGDADLLLGVIGDTVLLASEGQLYSVNWKTYDPEKPEDARAWESVPIEDGLRGRPFVTRDSIFVTSPHRMTQFSLATGKFVTDYPHAPQFWDDNEGPGNVLVTSDHVVIAGATHVHGFTDLGLARARWDRAVAAAPQDTKPRLEYASILFTAGDTAGALGKLDEAIALLGGLKSMRAEPGRDGVFNNSIAFAQKLAAVPAGATRDAAVVQAVALYDRAAAAAVTPAQQVQYRLSRAKFAEGAADAPGAALLYQQILAEPELRTVAVSDETTGGPSQAAIVSERAIKALVARAGAAVYEPFEQESARRLAEAQAAQPLSPDTLQSIALTFPNAKVAPQALLAAANGYEAAKQPGQAVQVLRQLYFKYPDSPDKGKVLESMARNYLALPGRIDVAAARLSQGAGLPDNPSLTQPLHLPDGKEIAKGTSFDAALDAIRKFSSEETTRKLPDFGFPMPYQNATAEQRRANPRWPLPPAGKELLIDQVASLAVPLREFARADRLIVGTSSGELAIYNVGEAKPIGKSPGLGEPPVASAWIGNAALAWSGGAVALLPEQGGSVTWRLNLKDLPNQEVVDLGSLNADPSAAEAGGAAMPDALEINRALIRRDNRRFNNVNGIPRQIILPPGALARPPVDAPEQIAEVRPVGDRIVLGTTTGRILALETATGKVAWQTRLSDRPADRIVVSEDFVVAKVSDEGTVRLVALDTFTGQLRGSKGFAVNTGEIPGNVALSPEGKLVYTLPNRIVIKDLYKPWDAAEAGAGAVVEQETPAFASAIGPEQLVIADGRILALGEFRSLAPAEGLTKRIVYVYSLQTGQPILLTPPKDGGAIDSSLLAGTESWDIKLRVVGPRLYILNPRTVLCYNLDHPEDHWGGQWDEYEDANIPNILDVFFGKNHLALLSLPGVPEPRKGHYQLLAFARYPGAPPDPAESGRLDYEPMIVEPQRPITAWQGVEGGFYYLTADAKLHFLSPKAN